MFYWHICKPYFLMLGHILYQHIPVKLSFSNTNYYKYLTTFAMLTNSHLIDSSIGIEILHHGCKFKIMG